MDNQQQSEAWLSAAECAQRIGLSVRALRHYERHGLVTPRRTDKQWRLYGPEDITRLNEVLALKGLGLSLSSIAALLRGHTTDLGRTLTLQDDALRAARGRAERGLALIEALRSKITAGIPVSIDDLTRLAKETKMTDSTNDTVAWRRYEQNRPRTEVAIDTSLYDDYAGYYRLEEGQFYVVSHRDGRIFTRVVGQSDIEIFPESPTLFFMKVLPVQVSFVRDPDGVVRSLVHHQNGAEIPARRVDAEPVRQAEEQLQKRIRDKVAAPDSEAILRRTIAEHMRGEPDFDNMAPPLAALAREQKDTVRAMLDAAGPLQALTFKGVGQAGFDVYHVRFENAEMEWGFALADDGKLGGLYLRPWP
ncbi:transcriptional regulator [Devosia sp. Root413D1]|uniref:MerR family transcriptional regulator n=1 Tax=unclassified Devosia TaxID=196773 RepID=UPI0006FBE515|nr:MerR family transcriptional regulator [Devosia sp. Root413D1]KQW86155.1 transcriptional regulator [Devosia sp. Root413D1]